MSRRTLIFFERAAQRSGVPRLADSLGTTEEKLSRSPCCNGKGRRRDTRRRPLPVLLISVTCAGGYAATPWRSSLPGVAPVQSPSVKVTSPLTRIWL